MVTIFSPMHKMAVHPLVLNMSTLPAAPLGKIIGTATSEEKKHTCRNCNTFFKICVEFLSHLTYETFFTIKITF